ncbi:hypothetical protein PWY87_34080 [Kribbella solani]|uniref:hypothetical protein n=1 Tax=Kribbella solani TaxID=236067 RepID=UPI0029BA848B|nr:hypothetical protein [Kribbella solani]MDX3006746.1 hypothetical protein [Kribbella solani]
MTVPAEQLPSLIERMIRIEAKLDTHNQTGADHEGRIRLLESAAAQQASIDARLQTGVQTFADHETRLRSLERRMWITAGVALLGGLIAGTVIGPLLGIGG